VDDQEAWNLLDKLLLVLELARSMNLVLCPDPFKNSLHKAHARVQRYGGGRFYIWFGILFEKRFLGHSSCPLLPNTGE
jgi:hypothetical protein